MIMFNQSGALKQITVSLTEAQVLAGGVFEALAAQANIAYDMVSVVSVIKDQTTPYNGGGNVDVLVDQQQYIADFLTAGTNSGSGIKYMDYNAAQGGGVSSLPNIVLNTAIQIQISASTLGNGSMTFYIMYRELSF